MNFLKNLWLTAVGAWLQLLIIAVAIAAFQFCPELAATGICLGLVLPPRDRIFRPPQLMLSGITLLGTTWEDELPNNFPIAGIDIVVDFVNGGTAPSSLTTNGALGIVKRVQIEKRSIVDPGVIVDAAGVRLLELASHEHINLDSATLESIAENYSTAGGAFDNSAKHRIIYPINFCPPQIGGHLRPRFMLDVNNHKDPPKIRIDFAASTDIYGAGSIANVYVHIVVRRYFMTPQLNDLILNSGGYIPTDQLEQSYAIGTGVSGKQEFRLAKKGKLTCLLGSMHKGGASVLRGDISESTTLGTESEWTLDVGGTPRLGWTMKDRKGINERSGVLNGATLTSSPKIGPALASATKYQDPAGFFLDFLSDDGSMEVQDLGGVLDIDAETAQNNICAVIGPVSSAATNGHTLYLLGRKILVDVSRWQGK